MKALKFNKLDRLLAMRYIKSHREPAKKVFVRLFEPYCDLFKFPHEEDMYEAIASLFITFGTSMLLNRHIDQKDIDVAINMDYMLMYGIVDHYIDCNDISSEEKENRMVIIKNIIYLDIKPDIMTKAIQVLYDIYQKYKHNDIVISYIRKAFEGEYFAYRIQYSEHTYDMYKKACGMKGSTMYCLHKAMNGLEINEKWDYNVGYLGQILDDISDVDSDNKNGIHTMATYILKRDGYLDSLFYDVSEEIAKFPDDNYTLYRAVMTTLSYYIVNESPHFTDELKLKALPYSLVKPGIKINQLLGKSLCDMLYQN